MVLPVNADPTASGGSFTIPTRSSGAVDWKTAVDELVAIDKAYLDTSSSFDTAELFNMESTIASPGFLQGYNIGVAGTNVGADVEFGQVVFPFKGVGGLSLRPYLMESVATVDQKFSYAAASNFCEFMDYVLSADDWIALRGGGFPNVSLGYVTKTNDQLRKTYFVP